MNKIVFAIIIFISLLRLGSGRLFDVDEAVFAQATKEMIQSGDWITPTYNGEPRYDKPILFYWLMAFSFKLFGVNEFAARFTSALSGLILCAVLYFFIKNLKGEKQAFYTILSFAFSLYYFIYTHAAVTDMALSLFISISLICFYMSEEKNKKFIYGFYIFSAFAFLTKGLIGIVFPFGIASVYLCIKKGFKGLKELYNLWAILLFLLISMPWYVAQILINGKEFIEQFFIKHHFMRYTGVISGHRGPIYFFIPVLIIGMFPWISFIGKAFKNFKRDALKQFSLVWAGFIFLFFSFSTTKLPNYILPAIPAFSILISYGMIEVNKNFSRIPYIFSAVISILIAGFLIVVKVKITNLLPYFNMSWLNVLLLIISFFAVISIYTFLRRERGFLLFAGLSFILILAISIKVLPAINEYMQGTLYKYSIYAKQNLQKNDVLITYKINKPSIPFYSDRRILRIDSEKELIESIKNKGITERKLNGVVISRVKDVEFLKSIGLNLIEEDRDYAIFTFSG
ncbi:glycosyltransferase family 39 protein [Thermodesulfovibrio sp. 3907-1M]|uniref:Glycosyltransferase family 39 protein n=1 Tax=Thermodesulfovibrio autotrophicus TaxID=3118333 RepID=A0AAU8GX74_9BACT